MLRLTILIRIPEGTAGSIRNRIAIVYGTDPEYSPGDRRNFRDNLFHQKEEETNRGGEVIPRG